MTGTTPDQGPATDVPRGRPAHEPATPGWWPRPPAVVLRRSRLERYRERRMADLATRRPQAHARVRAVQVSSRRFWDAVLPRRRVLAATLVAMLLTVFDATSTTVLIAWGTASEGNPLLAALIDRIGLVPAMAVRVGVGGGLTLVLAWLATWRREVRPVLAFAVAVLALVACLHVLGLAWGLA